MAQDAAKDVRSTIRPVGITNFRTGAEVNLQLFAWPDFHAPKGGLVAGVQRLDEPIDRPVLAAEAMVGHEVLMDAFS